MISLIVYLVVTIAGGLLLSFLLITMRSTKRRGDGTPYPTIILSLMACISGPFVYCEVLTKQNGPAMDAAIKKAYNDGPIDGKLQYYRIVSKSGDSARAIAVGVERASWGGTDRPIMSINLKNVGGKWTADSYTLLYSDAKAKDSIVWPPYR